MYPILKSHYVDFDINREDLVAVSATPEGASIYAAELNAKRKQDDIDREVSYVVGKKVKVV